MPPSTQPLVLASSSTYRRELLERLRVPFTVAAPAVDETPHPGEAPRATALRLAEAKARAGSLACPAAVVIGSDQLAVLDGQAIGKPGSHAAALEQLRALRGRSIVFHTALAVVDSRNSTCEVAEVPTTVTLRAYTDDEARRYLELDRPYDCTGSAKIESLGVALVESVESVDPTALIGLPLIKLIAMLRRVGIDVLGPP